MSKEARVPSKLLEKGVCTLFLCLYPVSHPLTFLLQSRVSKWGFLWPFSMPVHLEQHRLPVACSGALRHLLLQHFEALMDSQGLFRQSPGNATGSYAGSEFPFLGVIPYSPPVPGNLQGKASKKSTPVAHCHHHSLCIWLPRVMLGPYPKKNIWTVFYVPKPWGGSPASSLFVFLEATHVFPSSKLVGLSILSKSCYISYW